MRSARLSAPQTIEFVEVDQPEPGEGEALVKVQRVSVCGSDTHMMYDQDLPEEMYPLGTGRPCHEIAGTVVESRTDGLTEGQRVIVLPPFNAGDMSSGGLVDYITTTPEWAIPVPNEGDLGDWVMCQPIGTVHYATKLWGPTAGLRSAVIGQGAIGLSFTMLAAKQGAEQVVGLDLLDYRLDKARELGATGTINPDHDNPVEAIAEVTGGRGVDVVVDASGDPEGLNQAVDLVNKAGKVLGFTLFSPGSEVPFKHMNWMRSRSTIIPCSSYGSGDPTAAIKETVELVKRGWLDPGALVTHRMSFDDVPNAFDMYSNQKDGIIKAAITVNE
jgi:threonine dehydrogenase-like Zn-dependent dehydrogenase